MGLGPVDSVGTLIVTKAIGKSTQQDITATYKKQVSFLEVYDRLSNNLTLTGNSVAVHVSTSRVLIGTAVPIVVHVMSQPSPVPLKAKFIVNAEYIT